ncbi:MAG: hypothetical protein K2O16_18505 [Lachnospiraceae bacterium]|nr:hypothetical protein [Lachnospiraceae bacterium]
MLYRTLLKANLKQHRAGLYGIFFLTLPVTAALGEVLAVWVNVGVYLRDEMQRAGFGDLTAWVSGNSDISEGIDYGI